ncbi:MAG: multi-sensor signal transduction histidine kinase [Actinomycetia bacterium]|nr:multi-sensor signal transduction histidine kinase [Actinomycetes bacterium]
MPSEKLLSQVLKEFAQTLLTDVPSQAILDGLVERIVEVLPITSAGVTLIVPGGDPEYIAASDPAALRYERLQTLLREGPCLTAYESGDAVAVPDLRLETRFPTFCARALAAGLRAVFTFPLHNGNERFGALDLYRETPGALSDDAVDAAKTLADVTSVYLVNARTRHEMQELASAQSDFVSKISHELRSPLTGVLGYAELLIDGAPGMQNKEQLRMLGVVERNSRQLLALIEDLLTMSRIDADEDDLKIGTVDLRDVIAHVQDTTAPAIAKAELDLIIDLGPDVRLEGDQEQLERAVLNLVSNAVKFTLPGGQIEVRTRTTGDDIAISVRDTGSGIPIAEQNKLFTRFFRGRQAKQRQVQGTGLGLYIVNHIVQSHRGVMQVTSSPKGSTFTMVLPIHGPSAGIPDARDIREPVPAGSPSR